MFIYKVYVLPVREVLEQPFPLESSMCKRAHVMLAHYCVNEIRAISPATWEPVCCSAPWPQTTTLTSVSNSVAVFSTLVVMRKPGKKIPVFQLRKKYMQYQ